MATASLPVSDDQRGAYSAQLELLSKDEVVGVLLALFLGGFGAHHFYLRRVGSGVLYVLLCWTGIPAVLGIVECFLMPGRVARYNQEQATLLQQAFDGAAAPRAFGALGEQRCPMCGAALALRARFCTHCGTALAV